MGYSTFAWPCQGHRDLLGVGYMSRAGVENRRGTFLGILLWPADNEGVVLSLDSSCGSEKPPLCSRIPRGTLHKRSGRLSLLAQRAGGVPRVGYGPTIVGGDPCSQRVG